MTKEIIPQYDLERAGWSVYCKKCADKINLDKITAKDKCIKIYNI